MPSREPSPSSYEVRGPETRREVMALADLYGKAFGQYQRLYDLFLDKHFHQMPREQWRLARALWAADGSPVAMVRVCDRTMRLGAALVRVAGIGDVCTLPTLRKRGLLRTLFTHVNQFMRDEGYDLSLLFGIPNFYTKFGFGGGDVVRMDVGIQRVDQLEIQACQYPEIALPGRQHRVDQDRLASLLAAEQVGVGTRYWLEQLSEQHGWLREL